MWWGPVTSTPWRLSLLSWFWGALSAISESTCSSGKSLTDFFPQKELGKSRLRAQHTLHFYGVDLGWGVLGSHHCSAFFDQIAMMTGLPRWLSVRSQPASARDAGDTGSIPGREDPLEKEMAMHASILTWRIPWTEKSDGLPSMESQSRTWL